MTEGPAWGEGDTLSEGAGESLPNGGVTKFGSGLIKIDEQKWQELLHHPMVVGAVMARAADIADAANSMANVDEKQIGRYGGAQAPYKVTLQNRSDTTRARARVKPATEAGYQDNARNNTLVRAMLMFPSDPRPSIPTDVDNPLSTEKLEQVVSAIETIAGRYGITGPGVAAAESGQEPE